MATFANRNLLLATLIGAIGICLWATETVLVTFTTGLPALEIVALAFATASLLSPIAWKISGGSPLDAFRQPLVVWLVTVPCLVLYHACIYYAVHRVPATPAALLHGATPLFIVLGSALLPGERIRWWHLAGAGLGAIGMIWLVDTGSGDFAVNEDSVWYLACIALAAGLWGVYSLLSRQFGEVPSSVMGTFYAAAAIAAGLGHLALETWVTPTLGQWAAIVTLGLLPMGLALYCWDYGVKRGDIQALGAASYVEPLIGGFLVVAVGQGQLHWSMILASALIVGGSVLAAGNLWGSKHRSVDDERESSRWPAMGVYAREGRGPLQDLRILFRCESIINERMRRALKSPVSAVHDTQSAVIIPPEVSLTSAQIEDLQRLASDAITMYTHISTLLEFVRRGDNHDFRKVYAAKALSSQELTSLTRLAVEAIRQLESIGEITSQPLYAGTGAAPNADKRAA